MRAPAIEVRALSRAFGELRAVDDLSLAVPGPGVFGFLGANGAGKTTTIRMLVGLIHPTAGEIRLLGEPLGARHGAVRSRLGYLPQSPGFPEWMTGEEYLLHVGDLFGLPRARSRQRAGEMLDRCGLDGAARRRRIGGYSGGMKQRLGIAQALINRPELVILDEPVSALDPVGRAEVLELIETLGREVTVFMSSHILADVERVCAEVAILDRGRLLLHEHTASLKARAVRPILSCVVRGDPTRLLAALARAAWAAEVALAPPEANAAGTASLRVVARDLEAAERALPALVAEAGVGLVSLTPAMPTLEEIFIALVQRDVAREASA